MIEAKELNSTICNPSCKWGPHSPWPSLIQGGGWSASREELEATQQCVGIYGPPISEVTVEEDSKSLLLILLYFFIYTTYLGVYGSFYFKDKSLCSSLLSFILSPPREII
jgi:hypothetical protein